MPGFTTVSWERQFHFHPAWIIGNILFGVYVCYKKSIYKYYLFCDQQTEWICIDKTTDSIGSLSCCSLIERTDNNNRNKKVSKQKLWKTTLKGCKNKFVEINIIGGSIINPVNSPKQIHVAYSFFLYNLCGSPYNIIL